MDACEELECMACIAYCCYEAGKSKGNNQQRQQQQYGAAFAPQYQQPFAAQQYAYQAGQPVAAYFQPGAQPTMAAPPTMYVQSQQQPQYYVQQPQFQAQGVPQQYPGNFQQYPGGAYNPPSAPPAYNPAMRR